MFTIPNPLHFILSFASLILSFASVVPSLSSVILSAAKNLILSLRTGCAKNPLISLETTSFPPHPNPLPPERKNRLFSRQSGGAFRHVFIKSPIANKKIFRLKPEHDIGKRLLQPQAVRCSRYGYYACLPAALGILFLLLTPAHGDSLYSRMKKGSDLYARGSYDEALKTFLDAQIEFPEDPQIKYNIAGTHYQLKNYEEAIKNYRDAAATARDTRLEEQAIYNIGNCLYRQGKLEEALEYYKKALEIDPDDQDAKYNLEFVREEIKKRINQAKQREQEQQQQQEQQEKKEEQGGQQQQQQQNQQQEGEQKNEGEQQQEQARQEKTDEQQQEQSAQQQQDKQEQTAGEEQQAASAREDKAAEGKEQPVQERHMTREEAENWLRSVKEGRRDYRKQQKEQATGSYRPSKDW